ncbi:MAG: hypothetical protein ABIH08_06870 [Candidatus Omnitrophota bacterium]
MLKNLEKYLLEAAGKNKDEIRPENPYREIGFDGISQRLGWVKTVSFSRIKESLANLSAILEGKQNFIFVGMGGSINGIKPLFTIFNEIPAKLQQAKQKNCFFYALDNLDPDALEVVLKGIDDLNKTLVISISKSGTTKETQLLSSALKEAFINRLGQGSWQEHFLWLSDPCSFEKLDSLGWTETMKVPIQFDSKADIGGRFSSPHTLIFFLPLFLLLNKNSAKLEEIYNYFVLIQKDVERKAYAACEKYANKTNAYFSPLIPEELGESFSSWIVQLFQESLGSKDDSLAVKTITNRKNNKELSSLRLDLEINDPAAALMAQMYFFQIFVAYYAAMKEVNFVTQNFVEKYKNQVRELENSPVKAKMPKIVDLTEAINEVKKNINPKQHFIEVVLYFYPQPEIIDRIKKEFSREFEQEILVFVGSDWNHQSYQAAFADKNTFYVLFVACEYKHSVAGLPASILLENSNTLKTIAKATYLTLKDKSLFLSFSKESYKKK